MASARAAAALALPALAPTSRSASAVRAAAVRARALVQRRRGRACARKARIYWRAAGAEQTRAARRRGLAHLDQPIGKGRLGAARRAVATGRPAAWRTRDPDQLARPTCLEQADRRGGRRGGGGGARVGADGMLFVALADEASRRSTTRCSTPAGVPPAAAFRAFRRARFADIDGLNDALGTSYATIDAAVPLEPTRRATAARDRTPADLRAVTLTSSISSSPTRSVRSSVTSLPLSPACQSAHGARCARRTAARLRALARGAHARRALRDRRHRVGAGLLPARAHRYETLAPPAEGAATAQLSLQEYVRARLAAMACRGTAGVVVWNDRTVAGTDGQSALVAPSPRGPDPGAQLTRCRRDA